MTGRMMVGSTFRALWPLLPLFAVMVGGAGAETVGSVTFTPPPGWTARVQDGLATLTPAGGAAQGALLLIPDQAVSGDVRTWFAATVTDLSRDGTVTERSSVEARELRPGTTLLLQLLNVRLAQGVQYRSYTALVTAGKATLYVLVAPSRAAFEAHQPALVALLNPPATGGAVAATGKAGTLLGPRATLPAVKAQNAAAFLASGGTPETQAIPDEFRCYRERAGDSLSPELTLQILPGGKYRTPYGAGSFRVNKDGSLIKTEWQGGPLAGASGYLNLDDWGQTLSLSNVGEGVLEDDIDFECYQRGPRENLQLLQFRLKTPAPASYPCVLQDGSGRSGGTLEILPNRAYRLNGKTGTYSVDFRSDQDDDWSDLDFSGGALDDATGTYQEDEDGVRELSVFRPKMTCSKVVKPTPIPRYGAGQAPAPPRGSGGLEGAYATWRVDVATSCGGLCWSMYVFDKTGYVYTNEPDESLAEADCRRTRPNGLPVCEVYRVQGATIRFGQEKAEAFARVGRDLEIGGQTYQRIVALDGLKLAATYESRSGFGGATSTTVGLFQNEYTFTRAGTFVSARSGGVSSTLTTDGTAAGDVIGGVSSSTQGGSRGTYRFVGHALELTFADGHVERKFAFALPDKAGKADLDLLRLGGSSYTVPDGK